MSLASLGRFFHLSSYSLNTSCSSFSSSGFLLDAYIISHVVQIDEGDGAFYGPKIDISVSDALNRKFQCATLQVYDPFYF